MCLYLQYGQVVWWPEYLGQDCWPLWVRPVFEPCCPPCYWWLMSCQIRLGTFLCTTFCRVIKKEGPFLSPPYCWERKIKTRVAQGLGILQLCQSTACRLDQTRAELIPKEVLPTFMSHSKAFWTSQGVTGNRMKLQAEFSGVIPDIQKCIPGAQITCRFKFYNFCVKLAPNLE